MCYVQLITQKKCYVLYTANYVAKSGMYYTQLITYKKQYVLYTTNRIEKAVCIIHNYNVAKSGMYYA